MQQMQQPPNPPINRDVPNIVGNRGGLYPRWWILSAFITSILAVLLLLLGPHIACSATGNLCHFASWHPVIQVLVIWLAFILIWLLALIFGIGSIEVPRRERSRAAEFISSASEFGPLHLLLLIFGGLALCGLIAMWILDSTTGLAFAFCSIVVYVANASLFFRRTGYQQRNSLIGYGILGLLGLVLTLLYRLQDPREQPFYLAEALLIIAGIWAIFWRPRPAQETAQEQWDANLAQTTSPLYILRSFWPFNRLFPNRPL